MKNNNAESISLCQHQINDRSIVSARGRQPLTWRSWDILFFPNHTRHLLSGELHCSLSRVVQLSLLGYVSSTTVQGVDLIERTRLRWPCILRTLLRSSVNRCWFRMWFFLDVFCGKSIPYGRKWNAAILLIMPMPAWTMICTPTATQMLATLAFIRHRRGFRRRWTDLSNAIRRRYLISVQVLVTNHPRTSNTNRIKPHVSVCIRCDGQDRQRPIPT